MGHILIVDDQPDICWGLKRIAEQLGHTAESVATAEEALSRVLSTNPDVVVMDVRLPGMTGLDAMQELKKKGWEGPVVVITAYGDVEVAVEAVRQGAFEYLTKPFDLKVVARAIERAVASRLSTPTDEKTGELEERSWPQIVGVSPAMQQVFKQIAMVAPTDAAVHIVGESGTGKELVARSIHGFSHRRKGPLVAAHIAALSPSLAESELFGHVRGAFTGADYDHVGLLQRAHGGTLFIDEVAEIPLNLQVKLLRAIEYQEVTPVGAVRPIPCDFRIISATHRDLRKLVAEGKFRHDLYYRLITFEIRVPPLRERPEDIEPLTKFFLKELCRRMEKPVPHWTPEFMAALLSRPWWGNVRELRSALEHALILCRGGLLHPDLLPPPLPQASSQVTAVASNLQDCVRQWTQDVLKTGQAVGHIHQEFLDIVEPVLFETVLQHYGGQYVNAARALGIHRVTLRRKMDRVKRSESGQQWFR
ncbi:MAG TPA: sigma-54 dependent transcriptional regulator [Thermogutta sp.]|nr:sigma-54 dependent transcriptional regulator [Thermogutta sp.]HPU07508.1 sigma-54 dependent transcriptional regulator [Thermogutta sp.]